MIAIKFHKEKNYNFLFLRINRGGIRNAGSLDSTHGITRFENNSFHIKYRYEINITFTLRISIKIHNFFKIFNRNGWNKSSIIIYKHLATQILKV